MERKNTVLLTVIAIATLLVAVVGATFAYFTATNNATGDKGDITDVTTATVKGVELTASTVLSAAGKLDYPGGVLVTGTTIKATTKDGDTNNYEVSYDLGLKATNGTNQTLKWYLVRMPQAHESFSNPSCELKSDGVGNETHYYYQGCSAKNVLTSLDDGTLVGFGEIEPNASDSKLTSKNDEDMTNDDNLTEIFDTDDTKSLGLTNQVLKTNGVKGQKDTNEYTYYLVVEFPNQVSDQSDSGNNFNKQISVTYDDITNIVSKVITSE